MAIHNLQESRDALRLCGAFNHEDFELTIEEDHILAAIRAIPKSTEDAVHDMLDLAARVAQIAATSLNTREAPLSSRTQLR